jgi:hypothetical protein
MESRRSPRAGGRQQSCEPTSFCYHAIGPKRRNPGLWGWNLWGTVRAKDLPPVADGSAADAQIISSTHFASVGKTAFVVLGDTSREGRVGFNVLHVSVRNGHVYATVQKVKHLAAEKFFIPLDKRSYVILGRCPRTEFRHDSCNTAPR